VLSEVLGHGHGVMDARLRKIHKTLDPLFRALPKNRQGNINAPVMRYAVRRYFSQTHGWIVKGFSDEDQTNTSVVGASDMLQDKLPEYVRSLLEKRFVHQGFSLDAVVALIATIERMAFDEVVRGIELAYYLNDIDHAKALTRNDVKDVISSYLVVEMFEGSLVKENHTKDMQEIDLWYPHWDSTVLFLEDAVSNDIWQRQASLNPFSGEALLFEDALRVAESVSQEFGSWSNHECHMMKDMLMGMDLHDTGRVKTSDFYGFYANGGKWQFLEPFEQLRIAGALDESSTWLGPQVMIPNYIQGWSNCITFTVLLHLLPQ
jgi:hypothetical protein